MATNDDPFTRTFTVGALDIYQALAPGGCVEVQIRGKPAPTSLTACRTRSRRSKPTTRIWLGSIDTVDQPPRQRTLPVSVGSSAAEMSGHTGVSER